MTTPIAETSPVLTFRADFLDILGGVIDGTFAVIVTDLAGTVTRWNSYAETLYGWSATEAIGMPIDSLTVGPVTQEEADSIMESLRAGRHWAGGFEGRRRDGSLIRIEVIDAPVVDADGNLVGIVGISREHPGQLADSLEELDELRRLAGHLDEVRRQEARRIAAQIHDEFSQRLHLLVQKTLTVIDDPDIPEQHRADLESMAAMQRDLVASMQGLCGSLRPPLLDELGLAVAVEHLVESVGMLGVNVSFDLDPAVSSLDAERGEVVLAVVQECLSNVVSHAGAASCRVVVRTNAGTVEIEVADDGCGFDGRPGFGIRLMTERVRRLGGAIDITSRVAHGTEVIVRIPFES
jgi:two-component system, NarL family, sensor histidine kinase UhpB